MYRTMRAKFTKNCTIALKLEGSLFTTFLGGFQLVNFEIIPILIIRLNKGGFSAREFKVYFILKSKNREKVKIVYKGEKEQVQKMKVLRKKLRRHWRTGLKTPYTDYFLLHTKKANWVKSGREDRKDQLVSR